MQIERRKLQAQLFIKSDFNSHIKLFGMEYFSVTSTISF